MMPIEGQGQGLSLSLHEFQPRSQLVVPQTMVRKPRFKAVDAHNHLGELFGGGWEKRPLGELLSVLDEADVDLYVDLDGGWGESILEQHLDHFKQGAPERVVIFGGVVASGQRSGCEPRSAGERKG
jgi:hypothetical protein